MDTALRETKFSVLIPVYHQEDPEHFKVALQSIWENQTLRPNEVVVVEDGALTDELNRIIADFKKNIPIKSVKLPLQKGLGIALNQGLKACSNELVARMDSDDISLPDRFQKQIEYFRLNPEIDILGGQIVEFIDHPGHATGKRIVPFDNNAIRKYSKKRCPFNHPTVMFKKSVIEQVGSYQDFKPLEDYHLWFRIIGNNFKCANLTDDLLLFRMNTFFIERRHGYFYFTQEIKLALFAKKLGVISNSEVIRNIIIRGLPRLFPKKLLQQVYKLLRKH